MIEITESESPEQNNDLHVEQLYESDHLSYIHESTTSNQGMGTTCTLPCPYVRVESSSSSSHHTKQGKQSEDSDTSDESGMGVSQKTQPQ